MSDQLMDFSGRTGQELFRLLTQRASEELSGQSGFDRFTATLAAALIPVAEALRGRSSRPGMPTGWRTR